MVACCSPGSGAGRRALSALGSWFKAALRVAGMRGVVSALELGAERRVHWALGSKLPCAWRACGVWCACAARAAPALPGMGEGGLRALTEHSRDASSHTCLQHAGPAWLRYELVHPKVRRPAALWCSWSRRPLLPAPLLLLTS